MAISKIKSAGITADFANTLTAADLAANSVDSSELVDGSIDASHISSNAVTTAKVSDEGTLTQSAIKRSIHKAWVMGG